MFFSARLASVTWMPISGCIACPIPRCPNIIVVSFAFFFPPHGLHELGKFARLQSQVHIWYMKKSWLRAMKSRSENTNPRICDKYKILFNSYFIVVPLQVTPKAILMPKLYMWALLMPTTERFPIRLWMNLEWKK